MTFYNNIVYLRWVLVACNWDKGIGRYYRLAELIFYLISEVAFTGRVDNIQLKYRVRKLKVNMELAIKL